MAEESFQERTEAPTPRRREEARRKGQIARSAEVGTAFVLLGAAGVVHYGGRALGLDLVALVEGSFGTAPVPPVDLEATAAGLQEFGWIVLAAVAPVVLGISGLALAVGAIQARGTLAWEPLAPDWSRLAPHKNLRRLFGTRPLVELAKSVLKLVIVAVAIYIAVGGAWSEILALPQQSPGAVLAIAHRLATRLFLTAGLVFLALAAADYLYQLWEHERGLRMTREELKQELKDTEGDPMIKSRLRSLGRSLARRRMMAAVPSADVVVTNPTHIAVALRYDPQVAPAPVVVAMGQRKLAQRIKEIALAAGVPVIENKPLARALFATGRIGLPIPPELYVAVAEVLAFVYRQRDALRNRWRKEGAR